MKNLRPFWTRVTVSPSPVDEVERGSGLIVPLHAEGSDEFERGVVLAVAEDGLLPDSVGLLRPGMVVYYRCGIRIADVVVVERTDVIAYEDD